MRATIKRHHRKLSLSRVFGKRNHLKTLFYFFLLAALLYACATPSAPPTPSPSVVIKSTPTATRPGLPDLVITAITLEVDSGDKCEPLSGREWIQVQVKNRGDSAADTFSLQMNGKDQMVAGGLAAQGLIELEFPGYKRLVRVQVDSQNQVLESDEDNNNLTQEIPLPTTHPTCLLRPTSVIPSLMPSAVLEGHTARVWSVVFSPDGSLVASGSVDNTLRLWRVAQADLLRTMSGHPFPVLSVQFSPNGATLATGSVDGLVRLWQVSNSRLLQSLSGHAGWVTSIDISRDGSALASCGQDFTVRLWRLPDGYPLETIDEGLAAINDLAFSPDGDSLAWAESDGTVRLRSISGEWLHVLRNSPEAAGSIAFSTDGLWLAAGFSNGLIRIWDVAEGRLLQSLSGHSGAVSSLVFSADGRWLVSGSHDATIGLWRLSQDQVVDTPVLILIGHSDRVNSVAISPHNDLVASGADDNTVRIWPLPED